MECTDWGVVSNAQLLKVHYPALLSMIKIKVCDYSSHHKELLDSMATGQPGIPVHASEGHWAVISAEHFIIAECEFCTLTSQHFRRINISYFATGFTDF